MADDDKEKRTDDLVGKIQKNSYKDKNNIAKYQLDFDTVMVNSRRSLLDNEKFGSLDLTNKDAKNYFNEQLKKGFFKFGMEAYADEGGLEIPKNYDYDPSKVSARVRNATLALSSGLDESTLNRLVQSSNDIGQLMNLFTNEVQPQYLQNTLKQMGQDSYKPIRDASEEERKAIVKRIGLDKILDKTGQDIITRDENFSKLGSAIFANKEGSLNKNYFSRDEALGQYIK